MRFVELLVQGVRRFTGTHRFDLSSDATWLAGGTASGKTTLASLVRGALDHAYFLSIQESLAPWRPEQETARFALTLAGGDTRFRIIKDVKSGGAMAARFDPDQGKFVGAARTPDEVRELLADHLDFPDPADWAAVYLWSEAGAGASPLASAGPDATDERQIQGRLEELMAERSLMENVDEIQFEADGLQSRQFELQEELGRIEQRFEKLEALEAELEKTAVLEEMSENTVERARDFEAFRRRHNEAVLKREDAVEDLRERLHAARQRRTWHQDPVFVALAAGTLAGFIVPTALKMYALNLLGFAGIGGLGTMAWIYKRHGDELRALEAKLDEAAEELAALERDGREKIEQIESLVRELGVLDAKDLLKRWEQRAALKEKYETLEAEIAEEGLQDAGEELQEELEGVRERLAQMEQTLEEGVGGAQRSMADIEAEIAEQERQLEMLRAGGGIATGETERALTPDERIAAAIEAGVRVSRRDAESFCEAAGQVASRVVDAVYPRTVKAVRFSPEGGATFVSAETGAAMDDREVHRGLRLATAAAAQLASARVAAQARSFPLLWDEPFTALDDAALARLAKVAGQAVGEGQLVVLSGRRALGSPFGQPVPIP